MATLKYKALAKRAQTAKNKKKKHESNKQTVLSILVCLVKGKDHSSSQWLSTAHHLIKPQGLWSHSPDNSQTTVSYQSGITFIQHWRQLTTAKTKQGLNTTTVQTQERSQLHTDLKGSCVSEGRRFADVDWWWEPQITASPPNEQWLH